MKVQNLENGQFIDLRIINSYFENNRLLVIYGPVEESPIINVLKIPKEIFERKLFSYKNVVYKDTVHYLILGLAIVEDEQFMVIMQTDGECKVFMCPIDIFLAKAYENKYAYHGYKFESINSPIDLYFPILEESYGDLPRLGDMSFKSLKGNMTAIYRTTNMIKNYILASAQILDTKYKPHKIIESKIPLYTEAMDMISSSKISCYIDSGYDESSSKILSTLDTINNEISLALNIKFNYKNKPYKFLGLVKDSLFTNHLGILIYNEILDVNEIYCDEAMDEIIEIIKEKLQEEKDKMVTIEVINNYGNHLLYAHKIALSSDLPLSTLPVFYNDMISISDGSMPFIEKCDDYDEFVDLFDNNLTAGIIFENSDDGLFYTINGVYFDFGTDKAYVIYSLKNEDFYEMLVTEFLSKINSNEFTVARNQYTYTVSDHIRVTTPTSYEKELVITNIIYHKKRR